MCGSDATLTVSRGIRENITARMCHSGIPASNSGAQPNLHSFGYPTLKLCTAATERPWPIFDSRNSGYKKILLGMYQSSTKVEERTDLCKENRSHKNPFPPNFSGLVYVCCFAHGMVRLSGLPHVIVWWSRPWYRVEPIYYTSWSKKLLGILVPLGHENRGFVTFLNFGAEPK